MRLFVGNGIGPLILASVAVAASTILSHAACMCDVSKDFNRILIFDAATGAAAAVSAKRKEDHCQFLISKRDDDDVNDDDTDEEKRYTAPPRRVDLIKRSFFSGAGGGPSFFRPLYHKRLSSFEVFSPRRERYKKSFSQTRGKPIDATSARRSRRRLRARRKTRFLRMRSFFRRRHRDLLRSSRFCSRCIEKIARNEWALR